MTEYVVNGQTVRVYRGAGAPSCEHYLFAEISGKEYFVATILPGMKRDDVQRILEEHPQLKSLSADALR